jgi:hypothetical protein
MSRSSVLATVASAAALALLASTAGGCAADTSDTASADADQTGALIKTGTYEAAGSPQAWTIKELVLKTDGSYVVKMYPGRAFPIEDVKTTTGKYTASGSTLTIKFGSGNVFEKWQVTKSGSKLHFVDLVESSEFDMTFAGTSTSDPAPEPVQGKDPGAPTPGPGGAELRCHSGAGDIFANLSVASSGAGHLKLSSAKSLSLSHVETVTLRKNPDSAGSPGWLSVVGDGNATDQKRYIFQIPTSFLSSGGKDKSLSMIVGSSDQDNAMEVSWGMVCTKL